MWLNNFNSNIASLSFTPGVVEPLAFYILDFSCLKSKISSCQHTQWSGTMGSCNPTTVGELQVSLAVGCSMYTFTNESISNLSGRMGVVGR